MPAQGCAGKVHRNMDVTLHRLPDIKMIFRNS